MDSLTRRHLIQRAALASGAVALGPAFWQRAVASAATPTDGPYGPLGPPDAHGIRLPQGFSARLIASGMDPVPGTSYVFPVQPDGQMTLGRPDGGWILVTNSEAPPPQGGASAIQFRPDGEIESAYRILSGTTLNCAGGRTPWGTWLSCEEVDESEAAGGPFPPGTALPANPFRGAVWECDPSQPGQGVRRPALGLFKHEAVCVDPVGQQLYLTEDLRDGCFYRFTPEQYPDLSAGVLEAAIVGAGGHVTWAPVPNPQAPPGTTPTREQVEGATRFARAEGIWFDSGMVYVATTADSTVHAYDTVSRRHSVVYQAETTPDAPITDPDNIAVSPSGDLFICENTDGSDGGLDIGLLTPDLTISRFLRVEGPKHIYDAPVLGPSELCGVVFDPSGTRMYFTSQRARESGGGDEPGPGEVYEVTGPFRLARPRTGPLSPGNPREAGQAIGPGQGRRGARLPGSALGIEVPRRISWKRFHERGLPVAITLAAPAEVEVTVSARFTAAADRGRGGARRRRRLEREERRYRRAGTRLIGVRAGRRTKRLLGRRRHALRLAVRVAVDGDAITRTTVLSAPRCRRARRRRRRRGR